MSRLLPLLLALLLALPARADRGFDPFEVVDVPGPAGAGLPLDATLADELGNPVRLGDLLDGRPAILAPVYYRCPNVCSVTLAGLMTALSTVPLRPGADYTVIAYSIDHGEDPADARSARDKALQRYRGAADAPAFRFLTGSRDEIERVSRAIGFRYARDPRSGQFAHAAAIAALTPEGRVARWLYGLNYQPEDLQLALLDAGGGRIGGLGGRLMLLCHSYDPATGTYRNLVQPLLMAGGGLTLAALAGFVGLSLWRERAGVRR